MSLGRSLYRYLIPYMYIFIHKYCWLCRSNKLPWFCTTSLDGTRTKRTISSNNARDYRLFLNIYKMIFITWCKSELITAKLTMWFLAMFQPFFEASLMNVTDTTATFTRVKERLIFIRCSSTNTTNIVFNYCTKSHTWDESFMRVKKEISESCSR